VVRFLYTVAKQHIPLGDTSEKKTANLYPKRSDTNDTEIFTDTE